MKYLSAISGLAATLALAACMGTNEGEPNKVTTEDLPQHGLGYAIGLTKKAVEAVDAAQAAQKGRATAAASSDPTLALAKSQLQAAGVCQGLLSVFDDLEQFEADITADPFSLEDHFILDYPNIHRLLTCTIPAIEKALDSNATVTSFASSLQDVRALSDCICGGSGSIFGIYDGYVNGTWNGFTPIEATGNGYSTSSNAMGNGFNAQATQTLGNAFSPSQSPLGNGFETVTP
jgi:hypothetical protein